MATTTLAVRKRVPPNSNLAKKERMLLMAVASWGESFVKIGIVLQSIYDDEDWRDGDFSNFEDYMNEHQPCGFNARRGRQYMAAAKIRALLPSDNGERNNLFLWTEGSIRPLTHKDFNKSDVRRLGKKIATRVRKGEKLTATLVKEVCDIDRGVSNQKARKQAEQLRATDTPADVLRGIEGQVSLWLKSLAEVPATFWEDAVADDPRCIKDAIARLSELASFLRS